MACLPAASHGEDWPCWRGVARDGISRETGLLTEWPAGGPPQVWVSREAGLGYSGMAVVGDTLFTLGAVDGKEHAMALNVADGTKKWSTPLADVLGNDWGDGPRGTPAVDGEFVYVLTGKGTCACLRSSDGEVVWTKDFVADFGGGIPGWGYTESLLVDGDRVLGTPGGGGGAVVALHKLTGEVLWRSTDFTEGAQYSSIVPIEHAGQKQYLQLTSSWVVGLNADTGATLWKAEWPGKVAVIPTPIFDDGTVYVTSGYGVGCKLVRLGSNGQVETVFENQLMKNHHGGVVKVGEHYYGHSDGVGWLCQDGQTGEIVWNEKSALGKGALACADGLLYLQSEDEGNIRLVEATPEGWTERGSFQLEPQTQLRKPNGRIWTHPTVANGKLYLRDQELVFCYDIAAK